MPTGAHKSSGCNVFDTEPITAIDISTKEKSFIAVTGRKSKFITTRLHTVVCVMRQTLSVYILFTLYHSTNNQSTLQIHNTNSALM